MFKQGYTCAQAVVGAFADVLDIDMKTAMALASSFGGGMGRLREVCGAVSGMFMAAGVLFGFSEPPEANAKREHYALIQQLAARFREKNGSIVCRELLGVAGAQSPTPEARTAEYYKKRPCVGLVGDAAEILEELLTVRGVLPEEEQ